MQMAVRTYWPIASDFFIRSFHYVGIDSLPLELRRQYGNPILNFYLNTGS